MKITKTEQVLFRQGESTENTYTVTVLKYRAKFGGMDSREFELSVTFCRCYKWLKFMTQGKKKFTC